MVEKGRTAKAQLTLESLNGTKRWQFELAPNTPLGMKQLKEALVHEFIGDEADDEDYELTVGGTLGSPSFILTEKKQSFIKNPEPIE
jgi:hypothetical protein